MNNFTEYDFLCHHGVLGMKWGVRRYQNYDGTLIKKAGEITKKAAGEISKKAGEIRYRNYDGTLVKAGSAIRRKTKYTNIDGSLNERGKLHSQAYINRQIKKNEKYYDRYIKKYEKLAEKYKDDPEMKKKFESMKEDAMRTRDSVNESIKAMGIDEIMANEAETKNKILKTIGTIAAGTAIATGSGLTISSIAKGLSNTSGELKNVIDRVNLKDPVGTVMDITQNTSLGAKAEEGLNTVIGYYAGARSYALALYMNQAMKMLDQKGVLSNAGNLFGGAVNDAMNTIDQNRVYELSNTVNSSFNNVVNNAANANYQGIINNINVNARKLETDSISSAINSIINTSQPTINSAINNTAKTAQQAISNTYNSSQPKTNAILPKANEAYSKLNSNDIISAKLNEAYSKFSNTVAPDLNKIENQIPILMNDYNYKDLIQKINDYRLSGRN